MSNHFLHELALRREQNRVRDAEARLGNAHLAWILVIIFVVIPVVVAVVR